MEFWPLFIKLCGRPVVVVGGGSIAVRKVRSLHQAGTRLKVVASQVCDELRLLAKHRTLSLIEREFKDEDIGNNYA